MEWIHPLILSTMAGLATGLGALIKEPGKRTFGFGTGFAAGIMITMAFFELILKTWKISGPTWIYYMLVAHIFIGFFITPYLLFV